MQGRVYAIPFNGVAVTAQQDFFEIVSASTKLVEIHSIHLSQETNVSDANEKELRIAVKTGQTTTGSGGSTVTPTPRVSGDAAFAGTTKANNTTKASTGTIVTHDVRTWNTRVPLDIFYPPDQRVVLAPSARGTVELLTTPAASTTMSGVVIVEELG